MAEIINPKSAAPKIGPKLLTGTCNVFAMDDARNPML
jgi:hypothetical protein